MLQNAYSLAKIGADTAEHEQHFAETLPKAGNYPLGPAGRGSAHGRARPNRTAKYVDPLVLHLNHRATYDPLGAYQDLLVLEIHKCVKRSAMSESH